MKRLLYLVGWLGVIHTAWAQSTFDAIQAFTADQVPTTFVSATGGWAFQPKKDMVVTDLGCLDFVFMDWGPNIQIGLWSSTGQLLASDSITTTNLPTGANRYQSIAPVALNSGQTYIIGAYGANGISFSIVDPSGTPPTVTLAPDLTLINSATTPNNAFGFPSAAVPGLDGLMFLGPTFRYQANVPEPSSLALIGLGALGFAAWRKRRNT